MKIYPTKEWCERSAEIEGNSSVGAGCPPLAGSPSSEIMKQLYKITVTQTCVFEDFVEATSLEDAQKQKALCDADTYRPLHGSSHTQHVTQATPEEAAEFYGENAEPMRGENGTNLK